MITNVSKVWGVKRSHVAIHDWVYKVDLQPISTVTEDQIAVNEKMIRVNGDEPWPYGVGDPETNNIIHLNLFPSTTKQTMRWFLAEIHRRCQVDDLVFLVDVASYLGSVLDEYSYRFQMISNGNRNAIERIFCEIKRQTSSFTNSFSHITLETAQSWLESLAVYHSSRQN